MILFNFETENMEKSKSSTNGNETKEKVSQDDVNLDEEFKGASDCSGPKPKENGWMNFDFADNIIYILFFLALILIVGLAYIAARILCFAIQNKIDISNILSHLEC
ncbi:uncharacterized protein LOC112591482 [Melanaphis sacchari]|uniref:uncharacterized protein LOC112591482 n=1 Tax=Melanaphis sacchari TaxID=742174 RepID=UPI000DC13F7E|nr:uncharacterized protein LOC112591482 [Melanaphis sacchari]